MKYRKTKTTVAVFALHCIAVSAVSAETVIMQKQGTDFAIDGNHRSIQEGKQVYLWGTNEDNVNQQWIEISRGDNRYSYQKNNTSLCLDGGRGGERRQPIVLEDCSSSNGDQQWRKISTGGNTYRLEKSNSSGYSIDGNGGGDFRQGIYLWSSNSNNVNQQWEFISESGTSSPSPSPSPSPPAPPAPGDTNDDSGGSGQFGLNPNAEPWENFDLEDWKIDTVAFASDGDSESFGERDWDDISKDSEDYFFTHTDGGMRFVTRIDGAKTSSGTSYVRTELREMLRRGNESISTQGANGNNWALGYQPGNTNHAGRNGKLSVSLRVNKVTTSGDEDHHVGRTIIGQIHAGKDEPLKLYYRKMPGDSRGCIYIRVEPLGGDDIRFPIIGDENCNNPSDGIALDELFSYEIINDDEDITVRIRRGDQNGSTIGLRTIDLDQLDAGYDKSSEWMYFKAGAYTQNNTGRDNDGDIITFYRLVNTHDNN